MAVSKDDIGKLVNRINENLKGAFGKGALITCTVNVAGYPKFINGEYLIKFSNIYTKSEDITGFALVPLAGEAFMDERYNEVPNFDDESSMVFNFNDAIDIFIHEDRFSLTYTNSNYIIFKFCPIK